MTEIDEKKREKSIIIYAFEEIIIFRSKNNEEANR